MSFKLVWSFCFVIVGHIFCDSSGNKRILLSDPKYVHTIEVELQDLTTKVADLTSKYAAQGSKLNHIKQSLPKTGLYVQSTAKVIYGRGKLKQKEKPASGAMYTRWGRSSCSGNDTELVYTGFAGGSLYTDTGGAAEYVCMPKDPVDEFTDFNDIDGHIYGAQYETRFFGSTSTGQRAPCSVCRSSTRASILQIPGQHTCIAGWTKEYQGIMAAGYHDHKGRSQYICLDVDAEGQASSNSYDTGKLLYRVRSKCGSLACPPYVDGGILSCVVCTK